MEKGPPTIWTNRRKWAGNLAPLPLLLAPVVLGVLAIANGRSAIGIGLLSAGLPLGWLGLNLFGGTGSRAMRLDLARLLAARGEKIDLETPFVGFSTPAFRSALDAHQDVGFVFLDADAFRFRSETRHLKLPKPEVERVGLAANVHTAVGLGRWVTIEGHEKEVAFRLFLEPRTERTMFANRKAAVLLMEKIERWRKGR